MELRNKENGRNYRIDTEDGGIGFLIYAREIGGMDRFLMSYKTLADFLDDWEDID